MKAGLTEQEKLEYAQSIGVSVKELYDQDGNLHDQELEARILAKEQANRDEEQAKRDEKRMIERSGNCRFLSCLLWYPLRVRPLRGGRCSRRDRKEKPMSRRSGQIINRGTNKWQVKVFLHRNPETGKRVYHSKTIHGKKREAEKYLNGKLRERDLGTLIEPGGMLVGQYLDKWLNATRAARKPRTIEHYKRFLDDYVRPALGARKLDQVTPLDIEALYSDVQERASAYAVAHTHRVLHAALEQAVKWRYLPRNPAHGAVVPAEPRRAMCVLSADQASALRQKLDERPRGFVFTFSLATGMRPGEVQALQWKDCDLDAGTVVVVRTLVWLQDRKWQFGEPKTKQSRRTIPLPRFVVAALRTHRAAQAEHRLMVGEAYEDHDLVFASEVGLPLDAQNLAYRVLKPALKAAKLPKEFRWYDCRHTCATLLLAAGEHPKVVSERLGHAKVAFTLDRYAHVLPGMQERATERLESILFS